MLAAHKTNTNIGVGLGIILHIVARAMVASNPVVAVIAALVGTVLFVWGCCNYAQGKGYHWALGFLGLLSIIGLIVLALLPDKEK